MRARDAADRAAQREARRQKKVAKKERSRARAAAEAGAAAGPQLARPAEASSEGDTSQQSPTLLFSMKSPQEEPKEPGASLEKHCQGRNMCQCKDQLPACSWQEAVVHLLQGSSQEILYT